MKRCLISCYFFLICFAALGQRVDILLTQLDEVVANRNFYEKSKVQRIDLIKEALHQPGIREEERYRINTRLFREYEAYICDSARFYVDWNMRIATALGNQQWMNETKLNKAHILAASGLYPEALKLLESIRKEALNAEGLMDYYESFVNLYLYQTEYVTGDEEYKAIYQKIMYNYRDSLLSVAPENSHTYLITKAPVLVDAQRLEDAEALLLAYLPQLSPDTRNYAVVTSILAYIYQCSGDTVAQKEYLTRSAIADVKAVVKENNSLRSLAELLFEEGQMERADRYVKASMVDANVYNARLRNVQVSKMLPIIDRAYQLVKEKQEQRLKMLVVAISVLSLFLMLAVVYVIRQMKKLARARREVGLANDELRKLNDDLTEANVRQKQTNHLLTEANCIKEEYIGRFLSLCSAYIDKLEAYRRMLNKKAVSGKLEELYQTLKSTQFIDDELKEFYQNFDNSFLSIFPDFVESFNLLLPATEQIVPKQGERLTTELRIFALIRLGITDSSRIAGFLRYSITTIYTYRSKLKNKSLYRDDFEERVMKIASFDEGMR